MNDEISAAWKHRDLRILVIGEGVSTFGSLVSRLALPWTAARELGQGTLSECFAGLGTGMIGSVVIVHVTKTLGYDTGPQGVVYAMGGVGSLVAAGFAPRVLARFGLHRSIVVALLAVVPATSLMAFTPGPSLLGYAMLVGQQLLADPVGTVSLVAFGTVIAAGAPEAMRARVEATMSVLATLGMAGGFVLGGALGERSALGTADTLFLGAVVSASAALCLCGRAARRVHTVADISITAVGELSR